MTVNKKIILLGGGLIAAAVGLYFLTKGGTVPLPGALGGLTSDGGGSTVNDELPTVYQFPPEGAVNFPALPGFNDVFGLPAGSSKKTDFVNAMPGDVLEGITLKKPFTSGSSSNALGGSISPMGSVIGESIIGAFIGSLFGAPGAALVAVGSIAKSTPQGQDFLKTAGDALSGAVSSKKDTASRSPAGTVLAAPAYSGSKPYGDVGWGNRSSGGYTAALSTAIQSPGNITTETKKGNSVIQNYNAYKSAGGTAAPFI